MKNQNEFVQALRSLGGLHDSIVTALVWRPAESVLTLEFDDLYQNFEGLPEYPGAHAGIITLCGISDVQMNITDSQPMRVSEFGETADGFAVALTFCNGGSIRLRFQSAEYPELKVPPIQ